MSAITDIQTYFEQAVLNNVRYRPNEGLAGIENGNKTEHKHNLMQHYKSTVLSDLLNIVTRSKDFMYFQSISKTCGENVQKKRK